MMKKKQYLSPVTCSFAELETEFSILASSQIDMTIAVKPLEEFYYEGEDSDTSDYLIEL